MQRPDRCPDSFGPFLLAYLRECRDGLAQLFRLTGIGHLREFRHSPHPFPRGVLAGPPRLSYAFHGEVPICLRLQRQERVLDVVLDPELEPGCFDQWRLEAFARSYPEAMPAELEPARLAEYLAAARDEGLVEECKEAGGGPLYRMR